MKDRTIFGVTILAALLTAVRSDWYCHMVSAGYFQGKKIEEHPVVPANIEDYDIPIPQQDCSTRLIGVVASACNEHDFSLILKDKTQVHVHREESPDELDVTLELYCFDNHDILTDVKQNVHNSQRNKLSAVESSEGVTSEDVTNENKTSENKIIKDKTSEITIDKNKTAENVTDENKTSEDAKKYVYVSPRRKRCALKKKNKNKPLKKSKLKSFTSENATSENATPENATSENATSENATLENLTSENATSEIATSENASSENATSENASSENAISENATSENISENATSEYVTSENATSGKVAKKKNKKSKNGIAGYKNKERENLVPNQTSDRDGKSKLKKKVKKVKIVKDKNDKGVRRRRSAEMVDLELASNSSSGDITDGPKLNKYL